MTKSNFCRILLSVFLFSLTAFTVCSAAWNVCLPLDKEAYSESDPASSRCYQIVNGEKVDAGYSLGEFRSQNAKPNEPEPPSIPVVEIKNDPAPMAVETAAADSNSGRESVQNPGENFENPAGNSNNADYGNSYSDSNNPDYGNSYNNSDNTGYDNSNDDSYNAGFGNSYNNSDTTGYDNSNDDFYNAGFGNSYNNSGSTDFGYLNDGSNNADYGNFNDDSGSTDFENFNDDYNYSLIEGADNDSGTGSFDDDDNAPVYTEPEGPGNTLNSDDFEDAGDENREDLSEGPADDTTAENSSAKDPDEENDEAGNTDETLTDITPLDPDPTSGENPEAEILPTIVPIPIAMPMLMSSVNLEGPLSQITLTAPANNAVLKNTSVEFYWTYSVSNKDESVPVDFTLKYKVIDGSGSATTEQSVTPTCGDAICEYGPISFNDKDQVFWEVNGTFDLNGKENSITSDTYSFTIDTGITPDPTAIPVPDQPVLISPKGKVESLSVDFTWKPANNARNYSVSWENDDGDEATLSLSNDDTTCKNGSCSVHTTLPAEGQYSWTVMAINENGHTTSSAMEFSISEKKPTPVPDPAPGKPVQECPKGDYDTRAIGFYWAPSKYAKSYIVNWKNEHNHSGSLTLSADDATCKNNRCIIHANLPDDGRYSWTVTAVNDSGKATSGTMEFRIRGKQLSAPTPWSPSGSIYNRSYPTFQWSDVNGAYDFRLQVVGKYDSRTRFDQWIKPGNMYRGHGSCSYNSGLFLPSGTYSWRVMAGDGKGGASNWSGWRDFTVLYDNNNNNNNRNVNTVPTPSYPITTIATLTPEFQWRTLTGASYYNLSVLNGSGSVIYSATVPNSYCTAELCTFNPQLTLPGNGNYSWTIAGYSGAGTLWGKSAASFTVAAEIRQNDMAFLLPAQNGYLNPVTPSIIWSDPGTNTSYFTISITDSRRNVLLDTTLTRDDAWCDGVTCSIEFKTIPDALGYMLTVTPYSEMNTAGKPIVLVFNKGEEAQPIEMISPKAGSTVPNRPLFRWALSEGESAAYVLNLSDNAQNTTVYLLNCGTDGVNCEDGIGYFTPAEPLPAGTYTAVVSLTGHTAGADPTAFTIR